MYECISFFLAFYTNMRLFLFDSFLSSLLLQCCVTQLVSLPACLLVCVCVIQFIRWDKNFPMLLLVVSIMYMMRACEHAFFGYRFFCILLPHLVLRCRCNCFFRCPQYVYWMNIFLYDMPYMPQFISL